HRGRRHRSDRRPHRSDPRRTRPEGRHARVELPHLGRESLRHQGRRPGRDQGPYPGGRSRGAAGADGALRSGVLEVLRHQRQRDRHRRPPFHRLGPPRAPAAVNLRDTTAIAGIGYTELSKDSGRSTRTLVCQAIRSAIADAGLTVADIDGIATHQVNDCAPLGDVVAELGLRNLTWFAEELGGGGKAPAVVAQAALAVAAGAARCVVVFRAPNGRTGLRMGGSGVDRPIRSADLEFQRPYGMIAPAQNYALGARMHMNRYGTTAEQLGAVAVTQRAHAVHNPRALMRTPIDLDDYLGSRWITEPLRLLDCCLETDGACALVVTSADRAADLRRPVVTLTGWAWGIGMNDFSNSDADLTTTPARLVARQLFERTGLGPTDIDVAELYDAFSISV